MEPPSPPGPFPAWVYCENCEDYLCTIHEVHVYDCACPPLEDWVERGVDPYTDGGRSPPTPPHDGE